MREVKIGRGTLALRDKEIDCFIEKKVTAFGNSGKVDCPKRFIGRRAYVIVCKG